jgi:hypothetical protein
MNTSVILSMPNEAASRAARTLVMALGLIPVMLERTKNLKDQLLPLLQMSPHTTALLDLSSLPADTAHLLVLHEQLPPELRARVMLTRHEQGPVWSSDTAWAQSLGFATLVADVIGAVMRQPGSSMVIGTSAGADADVQYLPALLAKLAGVTALSLQQIGNYFAALSSKPDPNTSRGLIRTCTQLDAEALALAVSSGVKSINRTYRLTDYPSCILGTEAVRWLRKTYRLSTAVAVSVGSALQSLGLLHHVVYEQPFADEPNFYRLDVTALATQTDVRKLLLLLKDSNIAEIKDRSYRNTLYPQCWVGSDVVKTVAVANRMPTHEAENLLNRLWRYGLIAHVTNSHMVKDGKFFYRFVGI